MEVYLKHMYNYMKYVYIEIYVYTILKVPSDKANHTCENML